MKGKKVIALAALSSVFATSVLTGVGQSASASIVSRVGSAMRNSVRSVSSLSRSSSFSSSSSVRPVSISQRISNLETNQAVENRRAGLSSAFTLSRLSELSQRIGDLEQARDLERQKNASPLNRAVMVSGLVGSAAMVAGVVGGIIQQKKMMGLASEQSSIDQRAQKDLNDKRQTLQDKEIPEAVQDIIDYYKDHYGIQLTTKEN